MNKLRNFKRLSWSSWLGIVALTSVSSIQCTDDNNPQQSGFKGDNSFEDGGKADAKFSPREAAVPDNKVLDAGKTQVTWADCDTSVWPIEENFALPGPDVQCATITVPLDHNLPQGKQFNLRIARQKGKNFPQTKAMFFLVGGPGGSSVWDSGNTPGLFPNMQSTFDFIYIDQRGTGGSDYLDCAKVDPATNQPYASQKEYYEACAKSYASKDLNHYLTLDAAKDMDWVRNLLGYEKIYLYGVSYGSHLGLEYIRQFGDRVGAAVLDGLFPPEWDNFSYNIKRTGIALAQLIEDCKQDAACLAVSPTLAEDLENRRKALQAKPRSITINFGNNQEQVSEENDNTFSILLDNFLGEAFFRYNLPRAVHQAVMGNNTLWNKLMSYLVGGTVSDAKGSSGQSYFAVPRIIHPFYRRTTYSKNIAWGADGFHALIMCAERFPNSPGLAGLKDIAANDVWGKDFDMGLAESCASWKVSPISKELRSPVTSDVKVLLSSGDVDINTPKALGDEVAKTLSHATHMVIPYATHPSIMQGYTPAKPQGCTAKIMENFFLADGDMAKVDMSCIKSIPKPGW